MPTQSTDDDQIDSYTTPEEQLNTKDVSPEDRRREYAQQEGREIDATPLPSDDGDDADDESDREA